MQDVLKAAYSRNIARVIIRKRLLVLLMFLGLIIAPALVAWVWISSDRQYETVEEDMVPRRLPNDWANNVKVGIIGDSWVAGHKIDSTLAESMKIQGVDVTVVSSGHSGGKSRDIYRDMYLDEGQSTSSKSIIEDPYVRYLIVIAGVNDSQGHNGADYYSHHVKGIVLAAKNRNIYPVILEVPEYDIEEVSAPGAVYTAKRFVYRWLFDGGKQNVIYDYRAALQKQLATMDGGGYRILSFDPIATDFTAKQDIYRDQLHLNNQGNILLAKYLADEIVKIHLAKKWE